MNRRSTTNQVSFILWVMTILCIGIICTKTDTERNTPKPKADFTFNTQNQGVLPNTVSFTSAATNATSLSWDFGNGATSIASNPQAVYTNAGTYSVKLVATNQYGVDSITKQVSITQNKPTPNFTFTIKNQGFLPDTVDFVSTATNATSLKWYFGDGNIDTITNPRNGYTTHGTFNVKLVATNGAGSDSITKQVTISLNKPVAGFSFVTSSLEVLPATLTTTNITVGSNITYTWSFGNGTSSQASPVHNFTSGGIYNIKLVATNASGSDSVTKELRISPYPQAYKSINGLNLNLYAWEGQKVMILSRSNTLNRATMFKWVKAMDSTYGYYKSSTGREPNQFAPTYINNRTTIADVPATCGAGCGYLGFTGFEMQNTFFDINYNVINNNNQFDHLCFYEFGRNFWFFGGKVDYKEAGSFPIAGAFAVWMGSMEGRNAIGVAGSAVNGETFTQARARFASFVDRYVADPNLNWANTLAVDKGVPGHCNAADLFTSMCMRLKRDYGDDTFLRNIWKNVALRPDAKTTQDAVDNFFLAACKTANKNLTPVFQTWRWPLSASAIIEAAKYP